MNFNSVRIRFVACHKDNVYCSDLGLGRIYVTSLKKAETRVITCDGDGGRNLLKSAAGLDVDPAGIDFKFYV